MRFSMANTSESSNSVTDTIPIPLAVHKIDQEEEEEEELVMSEVHIGCPPHCSGPHISTFTISLPSGFATRFRYDVPLEDSSTHDKISLDEDGDLVVARRSRHHDKKEALNTKEHASKLQLLSLLHLNEFHIHAESSTHCFSVTIQHNITSSIPNVGLQMWKAELALSDFVLHKIRASSQLYGITSLELGAGTGLAGMLLARVARTVFLTDRGDDILDNCVKNVSFNHSIIDYAAVPCVRELDWMKSWPPDVKLEGAGSEGRYSWTLAEVEEAGRASVLLAADVIYSDDLTDALFNTLKALMSHGSEKILYLALEKRYNFSLDDMDVVANGYSHFLSFLSDEAEGNVHHCESVPGFVGRRIDLSEIPQYVLEYDRGNDVEIWEIGYFKDM